MITSYTALPVTTPEEQGVRSSGIRKFIEAVEAKGLELHSFMLLRHGSRIAQGWWSPFAPQLPHMLFSLSKSFTSSAVGLAVTEGLLTVDDPVVSFFPEETPEEVSENLAAMQVRHLLSMSTGHAEDTTRHMTSCADGNWARAFLSLPVEHRPGAPFVYNSGASYMLSAIVQKLTGKTVLDYLRPRLFEPLGITEPTWDSCPRGINVGGWGLNIRTEDIARFGQLYLQKGVWNGQRILPESWVEEATAKQVSNGDNPKSDWNQGYGYQFWRCQHGAYRGDGAFGQYCVVMPEQEAVLAITSGVNDMQAVLDQVWRHVLPAMQPAPLRSNRAAQARLAETVNRLRYDPPEGRPGSPVAAQISGADYALEPNEVKVKRLRIAFVDSQCTLTIESERGEDQVTCGYGSWQKGETTLFSNFGECRPVAASFGWIDENNLRLTLRFYTTPFSWTVTCRFSEDAIVVDTRPNVSFGPTDPPSLVGKKTVI